MPSGIMEEKVHFILKISCRETFFNDTCDEIIKHKGRPKTEMVLRGLGTMNSQ